MKTNAPRKTGGAFLYPAMDMNTLTKLVKAKAHELGFTLVGVCAPGAMASYDRYLAWLEAGYQADMDYLSRQPQVEKREDPQRILPECESILVLAAPYDKPELIAEAGRGQTAAYASGKDYHDVLPERLQAIVAFIEHQVGGPVPNRYYTDTGPILERELAQRAGLGWIGKNSMLINPQQGSYFLLAEILLGIELVPDAAFEADHCGTCTRCIEACPTDCILPERTLDAARCISYLTIENKGAIAEKLRGAIGDWVFGCDICQQVCPWNERFAPTAGDEAFRANEGSKAAELEAYLELDQPGFAAAFKGQPQKRAKRRGYLRNVAVALGNSGNAESIPALKERLLEDDEILVRAHSAWALGQLGGDEAETALKGRLKLRARKVCVRRSGRRWIGRLSCLCLAPAGPAR